MNFKTIGLLTISALLGGFIAWMFKSSQEEIDKIMNSSPKIRSNVIWVKKIFLAGDTPAAVGQFNGKGAVDIIVAGGKVNLGRGPKISALDGNTGKIIWSRRFAFPIVNEPIVIDITGDETKDVIVSGDSNNVFALNGSDGRLLWSLKSANNKFKFNGNYFNNITVVDDIDGDKVKDLVLIQGRKRKSTQPNIGLIFKVSGKKGKILSSSPPSMNSEISSNAAYISANSASSLIVPLGNEQENGKLISFNFSNLKEKWKYTFVKPGKILGPIVFSSTDSKSKLLSFVLNSNGTLLKLDAETGELEWKREHNNIVATAPPVVGHFNSDKILDVAALFSVGKSPNFSTGKIVWFDGATGEIIHETDFGLFAEAAPLTIDFNGDGHDELVVISNSDITRSASTPSLFAIFDGKNQTIIHKISFSGYSSGTPQIADLDGDRQLDLAITVHGQAFRIELRHASLATPKWYKFNGPHSNGTL